MCSSKTFEPWMTLRNKLPWLKSALWKLSGSLQHAKQLISWETLYHQAKCQYLPPTSYTTGLHILRAFYATNPVTNVLSQTSKILDPTLYGFEVVNDLLVLLFGNNPIPEEVRIKCNYWKCATQASPSWERHLPCCSFCKCRNNMDSISP